MREMFSLECNLRAPTHTIGTPRFRTEGYRDMIRQMMRVRGQDLWVVVKPGSKSRPPLLLFNGIGANVELAGAVHARNGRCRNRDLRNSGGRRFADLRRLPCPIVPRPSPAGRKGSSSQLGYERGIDVAQASRGAARWRNNSPINIPSSADMLDPGRDGARSAHGARQTVRSMEDGEPSALHRPESLNMQVDRGGNLWRRVPARS